MADMIMDNLMKIARLKDLFKGDTLSDEKGQLPIQGQGQMPIPGKGMPAQSPSMLSDYNQNARAMPQYEKPRLLNRLFNAGSAVLTNLKTPQNTVPTYEALDQSGIERDTENWQKKGDQLYRGAVLEDREDDNRRNAEQIRLNAEIRETQNRLKEDDLRRKEDEFKRTAEQKDRQLKINEQRVDIWSKVAKGGTIIINRDGSGKVVYKDGTSVDAEGVDTMGKEELEDLKKRNRLIIVGAQQKAITDRKNMDDWDTFQLFDDNGKPTSLVQINQNNGQSRPVDISNASPEGGTIKPPANPTQDINRRLVNYQRALSEHPEWKEFIEINPDDKSVIVKAPGKFGFGSALGYGRDLTPEKAKEINDYLDGRTQRTTGAMPPVKPNTQPKITTKPEGNKVMPPIGQRKKGDKWTFPNGKVGTWDGTDWVI